jgi:hypothetical protein
MPLLKQLIVMARNSPQAAQRGPLAFVVDGKRGDTVRELAEFIEEGERPIRVFTNLHEARKWLDEVFKIEMKR